tara:strand:- start:52 stop:987 length:936 start_codon:yes stop_codon:yes gene_type:complete
MKTPFFSVIIPTYNQCDFLKNALASVFKQTFKKFEVIVIDNYSKDKTTKVIKSFKKKIIYKKIKNNGIIAKSRNLGIKLSKGKWLVFLDSDDYWSSKKLEKIYYEIKKNKIDVICHNEWIIDLENKTKKIWSYGPYESHFYKKILTYGNRNSTSASAVRKSFINKLNIFFDEKKNFVTAEDYDFFLKIAKNQGKFFFLHLPLGKHIFHKKSSSSKESRHTRSISFVLRHHVFKIQTFCEDRAVLWGRVLENLKIKESIFNLKDKKFQLKFLINFLKIFSAKPLKVTRILYFLIIKFFKQLLIYRYYSKKSF